MAKLISVSLAAFQYAIGWYIFKKPDLSGCGPLLSSLVVLLALFFVLWSLPLYPRRLRKMFYFANGFVQYLIAVFFIEYIMGCFWFPLETALLALLPKIAASIEESLVHADLSCNVPCEILRKEGTGMFISYLTSFLILIAAMHATRIINLNLLSSGISPFFQDLSRRVQKFFKKCPFNLGLGLRAPKPRKSPYCGPEADPVECIQDFETEDVPPISDSDCNYPFN